ncbi:hypothetical protein [uncultured Chloroflexus sp.]|uniref:hypothetical protein n=1 Tax=uncultured Chloroflexus sp. TaxID=214040 RepID=UPI00262C3555|nr:hypothetical protein [uncultured Chloroflexus sp.]
MDAVFTVIEPLPAAIAPPGPWQAQAVGSSFSRGEQPDMIWQARLPDEPAVAQAALRAALAQLGAHEVALATVEQRLQRVASGAISFSTALPPAEQALLNGLWAAQSEGVSFGLSDALQAQWQAAQEQIAALSVQSREALDGYATVETVQSERLIGCMRINRHGDSRSLLIADIDTTQAALHHQTLALALRSRAGLLRLIRVGWARRSDRRNHGCVTGWRSHGAAGSLAICARSIGRSAPIDGMMPVETLHRNVSPLPHRIRSIVMPAN